MAPRDDAHAAPHRKAIQDAISSYLSYKDRTHAIEVESQEILAAHSAETARMLREAVGEPRSVRDAVTARVQSRKTEFRNMESRSNLQVLTIASNFHRELEVIFQGIAAKDSHIAEVRADRFLFS